MRGELAVKLGRGCVAHREGMLATVIDAQRFDMGDKLGYMMANVELGLRHPQIGGAFAQYLRQRVGGT